MVNSPIVLEIMNWLIHLAAWQETVCFCWVLSHINVTGKEKAHSETKLAASAEGEIYNHRNYFVECVNVKHELPSGMKLNF